MIWDEMRLATINGAELAVWEGGSDGDPVVFVHGEMSDECAAVLQEPALAERFRLIHYHQRGWGKSPPSNRNASMSQAAADCHAVIQHLGVDRAHFAGQFSGGALLLQTARDFPESTHSLALMEPALPLVLEAPEFGEVLAEAAGKYASGDRAGAMEVLGKAIAGDDFREAFDRTLPPGYFERWVADADAIFEGRVDELQSWSFSDAEARRLDQPVANLTGARTRPYFRDIYMTLQMWFPRAENFVIPDATHAMLETNPQATAENLADFFSRHPID